MALDLYTAEIYNFLRSITIKHSFIANRIKEQTMLNNKLVYLSDTDNPYYLNMCGEYSPYNTPMYVNSVETGQSVLFSKNLLNTNPATYERYRLPSTKLDNLCTQYPSQKHLAESIIYPVESIDIAIEAEDFTILKYDSSLLQRNELPSMLQCLMDTVELFKNTWYVEAFLYADTYPVVLWSSMWQVIFFKLYLQRIKNIRTPEVHIEHIWQYLTSKGLKDYRDVLNINQQYWLYKNIDFLNRNRGKNNNLSILSDNLLNTYNVVLRQKSVMLNYTDGISAPLPIPEIISEDVNANTPPLENTDVIYETIESILQREVNNNLRQSNDIDILNQANDKFCNNTSTYHPTRIIEIDKKIMWLEYQSLYTRFIIQNYIYKYSKGYLVYPIQFNFNNSTVSKTLKLGEAIALLNYCIYIEYNANSQIGLESLDTLPIPTSMIVDTVFIDCLNIENITMNYDGLDYTYVENILPKLLNMDPSIVYTSPYKAMEYLEEKFQILYDTSIYQRSLADGLLNAAIEQVYKPYLLQGKLDVSFVQNYTTYKEWFEEDPDLLNLTNILKNSTTIELETFVALLVDSIFPSNMFDIVNKTNILDSKYLKLKELFVSLCSYTVGFLETKKDSYLNITLHNRYMNVSTEYTNETVIPNGLECDASLVLSTITEIENSSYLDSDVTIQSELELETPIVITDSISTVESSTIITIPNIYPVITETVIPGYTLEPAFATILDTSGPFNI